MLTAPSFLLAADDNPKLFVLPKLPYAYDALEPHIDAKTMEIHHDKHHAAYVANLNAAIKDTDLVGKKIENILANLSSVPEKIRMAVRNNGGGHYNHSLFWQMMSPTSGKPSAALGEAITAAFGGLDKLLAELKKSALARFGSGWAWVVSDGAGKLSITSSPNQDNTLLPDSKAKGAPILGIDVWEHAYYLKYQNKRPDYVDAFTKVINWEFVSSLYDAAKKG
jgi:Fe-Mn family superoxide dismutase